MTLVQHCRTSIFQQIDVCVHAHDEPIRQPCSHNLKEETGEIQEILPPSASVWPVRSQLAVRWRTETRNGKLFLVEKIIWMMTIRIPSTFSFLFFLLATDGWLIPITVQVFPGFIKYQNVLHKIVTTRTCGINAACLISMDEPSVSERRGDAAAEQRFSLSPGGLLPEPSVSQPRPLVKIMAAWNRNIWQGSLCATAGGLDTEAALININLSEGREWCWCDSPSRGEWRRRSSLKHKQLKTYKALMWTAAWELQCWSSTSGSGEEKKQQHGSRRSCWSSCAVLLFCLFRKMA